MLCLLCFSLTLILPLELDLTYPWPCLNLSLILPWIFRDLWSENLSWRDRDVISHQFFTYNCYFLVITTRRDEKPWTQVELLFSLLLFAQWQPYFDFCTINYNQTNSDQQSLIHGLNYSLWITSDISSSFRMNHHYVSELWH